MKTYIISLAIVLTILAGSATIAGWQERMVDKGGIIRIGSDIFLHSDGGHQPVGITNMYIVNGCDLRIVLNAKAGDKIVVWNAEEDAHLSSLGVQAGLYGAANSSTLELWKDGDKICIDDPWLDSVNADVAVWFKVLEAA